MAVRPPRRICGLATAWKKTMTWQGGGRTTMRNMDTNKWASRRNRQQMGIKEEPPTNGHQGGTANKWASRRGRQQMGIKEGPPRVMMICFVSWRCGLATGSGDTRNGDAARTFWRRKTTWQKYCHSRLVGTILVCKKWKLFPSSSHALLVESRGAEG